MEAITGIGLDELIFREDIEKGPFQSGVDRGRWHLISINWPHAVIAISAAEREKSPGEYAFRFELTNYRQSPPTAQPWDSEKDAPLAYEKRPYGRGRVGLAFRTDWQNGIALYLPCDRIAIKDHSWQNEHPHMIWAQKRDITQYLEIIYDLLNSSDYTGSRCPSA